MKTTSLLAFLTLLLPLGAAAAAQGTAQRTAVPPPDHIDLPRARFMPLGDLPGGGFSSLARGVSPDGSAVVGSSIGANGQEAFLWTRKDGIVGLGIPGEAKGVSSYGGVVVGYELSASGYAAFRWTPAGGMTNLGFLDPNNPFAIGTDVTADGMTFVGYSVGPLGETAFRWRETEGLVPLPDLPGGGTECRAYTISPDGQVIGGEAYSAAGFPSCYWDASLVPHDMGDLFGDPEDGACLSAAMYGEVLCGTSGIFGGAESYRYRNSMISVGDLPGGYTLSGAFGVSHTGTRMVGFGTETDLDTEAYLWESATGMRKLADVMLQDYGLDASRWHLEHATDISGDGQTIVGYGTNPAGKREAYLVYLPLPCRADFSGDGVVDLIDVGLFSEAWINLEPEGDFNGDGFFDQRDVTAYMFEFRRACS